MIQNHVRAELEVMAASQRGLPEPYHYASSAAFALRHGSFFRPAPPMPELPKGKPNCCFYNCSRVLLTPAGEQYQYAEGWAGRPGGLLHHAWLVDRHGRAMDVTCGFKRCAFYFGVVIPRDQLLAYGVDGGTSTAVLDDWKRCWPILRQPWSPEDTYQIALARIALAEKERAR